MICIQSLFVTLLNYIIDNFSGFFNNRKEAGKENGRAGSRWRKHIFCGLVIK